MLANGLTTEDMLTLAILKILSGSVRFRVLVLLRDRPEGMSVGDIAKSLGGSVSRISHQLSILRKSKLVSTAGMNIHVRYSINRTRVEALIDAICASPLAMKS